MNKQWVWYKCLRLEIGFWASPAPPTPHTLRKKPLLWKRPVSFSWDLKGVLLASEARLWWSLVRRRKTRELLPWSNKANSNMWLLRALFYSHGWVPGAGLTAQSGGLSWLPVLGCHKANFNFCLPPRRALVSSAIWAIGKDSESEGDWVLTGRTTFFRGQLLLSVPAQGEKKRSKDPRTHPVSSFRTRIHRAGFYNSFIYL